MGAEKKEEPASSVPASQSKTDALASDDGVVQVRRLNVQKRDRAATASTTGDDKKVRLDCGDLAPSAVGTSAHSGASVPELGASEGSRAAKKGKKRKIDPKDIPEFDFANEPNLLDQPQSSSAGTGKGDNKKKKQKPREQGLSGGMKAIEIPRFGLRPAQDVSQPKAGNKSGTFTS